MKRVAILMSSVLFTGLFIGSVYAGVEPSPFHEKGFDPQPEPPGVYKPIQPEDNFVTLSDGRKLEFVQNGAMKQVYLIQKNGNRALADGAFALPNGNQLTINKGVILQSR